MKVALLLIATGSRYHQYIEPFLESAQEFFVPHTVFLWTDVLVPGRFRGSYSQQFLIHHEGFPNTTLKRYQHFSSRAAILGFFDQIFYSDIDMRFVAPVGEEVFSDGITATLHPGYVNERGPTEPNPQSYAFCLPSNTAYYCGGFNGGNSKAFLNMAEELKTNIDMDTSRGITAVWHDESHLNHYLSKNPPAKVLDPSYCYPENAGPHYLDKWKAAGINPTPKILALTKVGPR